MNALLDAIGGAIICLVIFGSIASIFVLPRYFKSRERLQMQQTIRAAIERGQPLPPEMLDLMTRDSRPAPSAARDARAGVIWLGIAMGLAAFGLMMGYSFDNDHAQDALIGIAAFPGFIGVAYLIVALFNRGKGR
jgi:hypothetical protein